MIEELDHDHERRRSRSGCACAAKLALVVVRGTARLRQLSARHDGAVRGMCVEVRYPPSVDETTLHEADRLGRKIANLVGAIGVLAIEFFLSDRGLFVNEVALRPHNTGPLDDRGRAHESVHQPPPGRERSRPRTDRPGRGARRDGERRGRRRARFDRTPSTCAGAHVHDYGKSWRPGRKLGHVTVVGDDAHAAHVTAWESARAYGTGTRET